MRKPEGSEPARGPRAAAGRAAEDQALRLLSKAGLKLVERNYRVARGPSRRGGEIDLIVAAPDGTLVFVEVRSRTGATAGGAAASVSAAKRSRLVHAATCYLAALPRVPPCRFDVVAIDGGRLEWIPGAFEAA